MQRNTRLVKQFRNVIKILGVAIAVYLALTLKIWLTWESDEITTYDYLQQEEMEKWIEESNNENIYEEAILDVRKEFSRDDSMDFEQIMEEQEKKLIAYALKKEGTTRKAAAYLKMPQATLARKKTKYGL